MILVNGLFSFFFFIIIILFLEFTELVELKA
jgi:hypothetical protein